MPESELSDSSLEEFEDDYDDFECLDEAFVNPPIRALCIDLVSRNLLRYLDVNDLMTMREVCQSWKKAVFIDGRFLRLNEATIKSIEDISRFIELCKNTDYKFCTRFRVIIGTVSSKNQDIVKSTFIRFCKLIEPVATKLSIPAVALELIKQQPPAWNSLNILHCRFSDIREIVGCNFHRFQNLHELKISAHFTYDRLFLLGEKFVQKFLYSIVTLRHLRKLCICNMLTAFFTLVDIVYGMDEELLAPLEFFEWSLEGIEGLEDRDLFLMHNISVFIARILSKMKLLTTFSLCGMALELDAYRMIMQFSKESSLQEILLDVIPSYEGLAVSSNSLPSHDTLYQSWTQICPTDLNCISILHICFSTLSCSSINVFCMFPNIKTLYFSFWESPSYKSAIVQVSFKKVASALEQVSNRVDEIKIDGMQKISPAKVLSLYKTLIARISYTPRKIGLKGMDGIEDTAIRKMLLLWRHGVKELALHISSWPESNNSTIRSLITRKSPCVLNENDIPYYSFDLLEELELLEIRSTAAVDSGLLWILCTYIFPRMKSLKYLRLYGMDLGHPKNLGSFMILSSAAKNISIFVDNTSSGHREILQRPLNLLEIPSYIQEQYLKCLAPPKEKFNEHRPPNLSYSILRNIFSYLSPKELTVSMKVCKLWRNVYSAVSNCSCNEIIEWVVAEKTKIVFNESSDSSIQPITGKLFSNFNGCIYSQEKNLTQDVVNLMKDPVLDGMDKNLFIIEKSSTILKLLKSKQSFKFHDDDCFAKHSVVFVKEKQYQYVQYGTEFKSSSNRHPKLVICIGEWNSAYDDVIDLMEACKLKHILMKGLTPHTMKSLLPRIVKMNSLSGLEIFQDPGLDDSSLNYVSMLCCACFSLSSITLWNVISKKTISNILTFLKAQKFTLKSLKLRAPCNISDHFEFEFTKLTRLVLDEPPGRRILSFLKKHAELNHIFLLREDNAPVSRALSLESEPSPSGMCQRTYELSCNLQIFVTEPFNTSSSFKSMITSMRSFLSYFCCLQSLTLTNVYPGVFPTLFNTFSQLQKLHIKDAIDLHDSDLVGIPNFTGSFALFDVAVVTKTIRKIEEEFPTRKSLRSLSNLRYLQFDGGTYLTDWSVMLDIVKLKKLEHFSCKQCLISDFSIRILSDNLEKLSVLVTESPKVSSAAVDYFYSSRTCFSDK